MKSGPQFAGTALKRLEKRFGVSVDYYQPFNEATNLTTGVSTVQYHSQTIRRALVLPFTITRGFNYDTAFLAAGNGDAKSFSFGALHDKNESSVVFRQAELKLKPKMSDHIAWRGMRFDVKGIEPYPDIQLFVLTVARTQSCKDVYLRSASVISISNQGDL